MLLWGHALFQAESWCRAHFLDTGRKETLRKEGEQHSESCPKSQPASEQLCHAHREWGLGQSGNRCSDSSIVKKLLLGFN